MFILSDVSFVKRIHPSISISQFLGIRTPSSKLARKLGVDRGKDPSKKLYIYIYNLEGFSSFSQSFFFFEKREGEGKVSFSLLHRSKREEKFCPSEFISRLIIFN